MSKRKILRAYTRHLKCGHVMEPFDLEVNKDTELRFESDGTAILKETGRVPRLAAAKAQVKVISHVFKQAARQTRCLHCNEDVVLTSAKDALILDIVVRGAVRR